MKGFWTMELGPGSRVQDCRSSAVLNPLEPAWKYLILANLVDRRTSGFQVKGDSGNVGSRGVGAVCHKGLGGL